MSIFRGDASEVYALATDLRRVGARLVPALRLAMNEGGRAVADQWRANATTTAGAHGKHYPKAISAELAFGVRAISVNVGPESNKPQGGMSFEFGSKNQPPHLDGLKAMDAVAPQVEDLLAAVLAGTFVATTPTASTALREYTTRSGATRLATDAQIANWTRGSR